MKKIAIITLHAVRNYGSVIQAWATQRIFEKMGYKAVIIDYRRPWEVDGKDLFYLHNHSFKEVIRQIRNIPTKIRQRKVFRSFTYKHLNTTKRTYTSIVDLKKHLVEADYYCVGSDQVWNSRWNEGLIEAYYLAFANDAKYKFSFASSIGRESIEEDEGNRIYEYLQGFKAISVREQSSVKLLNNIGLQDVSLVLDPTLYIDRKELIKMAGLKRKKSTNYVLLIQLNHNKKFDRFAEEFARNKGMVLKRLCLRLDQVILPGKSILIPEVEMYLKSIYESDYVLTDSFHAVSFCLNFNKDFYCVLPQEYSTRIKSVLTTFGLMDRVVENFHIPKTGVKHIDFERVNKILSEQRNLTREYLLKSLD